MNGQLLAQSLVLGILTGGLYGLTSVGLSLIFGIMRIINIAHAALIVLGSYLALALFRSFGLDPLLSILLLIPFFLLLGGAIQWGILDKLSSKDLTLTVLATFGVAIIVEGLQGAIWSSTYVSIRTPYSLSSVQVAGLYIPVVRVMAGLASFVLLAAVFVLLYRTNLGRAIRATTQNRTAAQLVGVHAGFVTTVAFAAGLAMAGAAGPLLGMLYSFYPATHWLLIGKLLAIVVLGGLGSLTGTFAAALVLGVAEQVAGVTLPLEWGPMLFYVLLFGTLIVRPQGFFGAVRRGSL
ncbi:MAG: branched-chain amino acid ABC transporter permease [Chloroflexi bacterium]|nr:branched-chain amino acid ABC transporter permease [Chloroflexota bacterium]